MKHIEHPPRLTPHIFNILNIPNIPAQAPAAMLAGLLILFSCDTPSSDRLEDFRADMLYSDGSAQYRRPREPSSNERVTVKMRVGKNQARNVYLHTPGRRLPMAHGSSNALFDYFYAEIPPSTEATYYYFEVTHEVTQNAAPVYYSRRGVERKPPSPAVQFRTIPDFTVPGWMRGAVLYQIFVDRFYNGDPANDVLTNEYMYDDRPAVGITDWNQYPDSLRTYAEGSNRTREFYGGDLEGVIQKLDYLAELGIEGIYFNPLFVSPSNHKYDTQDYRFVDPHFGVILEDGGELIDPEAGVNRRAERYIRRTTSPANLEASNEKLKELIREARRRGIRVILDGVFNHAGSFHRWLDREGIHAESPAAGAHESNASPFVDYFLFDDLQGWPKNESYQAWYGIKTLPKLHFEGSRELQDSILGIAADWVGPEFGADGWRLDVAADLGFSPEFNHRFWKEFRNSVKAANADAVILAEVYGDSSAWLKGDEWDTIMNYDAFFDPVSWFLTGLEKHSYDYRGDLFNNSRVFAATLADTMAELPYGSLEIAMNQLSNHDHSRFLTRTGRRTDPLREGGMGERSDPARAGEGVNKGIMKQAAAMQMFMPGAPTLYYGDEAGVLGFTDPDNRRTYPWGNEDAELLEFFRKIIALRREFTAVRDGSFVILNSEDEGMFAFGRWNRESRIAVVTNNTDSQRPVSIPVDRIGLVDGESIAARFTFDESGHGPRGGGYTVKAGTITVEVPAYGGVILGQVFDDEASSRGNGIETAARFTGRPRVESIEKVSIEEQGPVIAVRFSRPMNQREIPQALRMSPGGTGGSETASGTPRGRFAWNGPTAYFIPDEPPSGKVRVTVLPRITSLEGGFALQEAYSRELEF